jgi:fatty acid desaturase
MFKGKKHQTEYKELAKKPLWRTLEVVFWLFSIWALISSSIAGWHSVCPRDSGTHSFHFLPSTPCNQGEAWTNAVGAFIFALFGLLILFWVIRRVIVYIAFGNTKPKVDPPKA